MTKGCTSSKGHCSGFLRGLQQLRLKIRQLGPTHVLNLSLTVGQQAGASRIKGTGSKTSKKESTESLRNSTRASVSWQKNLVECRKSGTTNFTERQCLVINLGNEGCLHCRVPFAQCDVLWSSPASGLAETDIKFSKTYALVAVVPMLTTPHVARSQQSIGVLIIDQIHQMQ